jgi:hypothetical protein
MNGNSRANNAFDRRTLLTSGMLAGLSVAAVGVAASAQAASPARPLRREPAGSRALAPRDFIATPQSPWKFCDKCKILYWGPEQTTSACPAGGTHGGGSSNYTVYMDPTLTDSNEQTGWSFCGKCKAMYYGVEQSASACPKGGTHGGPSANYMMFVNRVTVTGFSSQFNWQFCDKCKGMYYGPEQTSSRCPKGGTHGGPTAEYTMLFS